MTTHPNVRLMQSFLQAMYEGNISQASQLLHEQVTMHVPGTTGCDPLAGDYRGHAAFFKFFSQLAQIPSQTEQNTAIEHILADDRFILVIHRHQQSCKSIRHGLFVSVQDSKLKDFQELTFSANSLKEFRDFNYIR